MIWNRDLKYFGTSRKHWYQMPGLWSEITTTLMDLLAWLLMMAIMYLGQPWLSEIGRML